MDTIFMNSENSKTSKPHVFILTLTYKFDLRRFEKVLLYQILVFIKLKMSAPTLNDKFELPDESYSISDFQDYFDFKIILKY